MKKTIFVVLGIALLPACALAVDGVVLINQSTVVAAGGFPYIISQPGSYKLSGNLIMATSSTGNFSGIDVAIGIRSSNVDLDLNGFSIIVTNSNPNIGHAFYAIAELGTFSQISVRNGNIALITAGTGSDVNLANLPVAIYLHTSTQNNLAELAVTNNFTSAAVGVPVLVQGFIFDVGMTSLVRHCRFSRGLSRATCPSLIVENSGVSDLGYPAPCVAVHNSP